MYLLKSAVNWKDVADTAAGAGILALPGAAIGAGTAAWRSRKENQGKLKSVLMAAGIGGAGGIAGGALGSLAGGVGGGVLTTRKKHSNE